MYCVKQRKKTYCVPNSEKIVQTKNGRWMMICKCAECGITKTSFIKSTSGGGPLDAVVKGINIGKEISKTLFPQTKKMFKDYESGKIAKEVVNKKLLILINNYCGSFLKGKCTRTFPYKGGKWFNVDCD